MRLVSEVLTYALIALFLFGFWMFFMTDGVGRMGY